MDELLVVDEAEADHVRNAVCNLGVPRPRGKHVHRVADSGSVCCHDYDPLVDSRLPAVVRVLENEGLPEQSLSLHRYLCLFPTFPFLNIFVPHIRGISPLSSSFSLRLGHYTASTRSGHYPQYVQYLAEGRIVRHFQRPAFPYIAALYTMLWHHKLELLLVATNDFTGKDTLGQSLLTVSKDQRFRLPAHFFQGERMGLRFWLCGPGFALHQIPP